MRPQSWFRFWYSVMRLVYILLFAPTFVACVTMIFTWSLFRFAITLTWTLADHIWQRLISEGS